MGRGLGDQTEFTVAGLCLGAPNSRSRSPTIKPKEPHPKTSAAPAATSNGTVKSPEAEINIPVTSGAKDPPKFPPKFSEAVRMKSSKKLGLVVSSLVGLAIVATSNLASGIIAFADGTKMRWDIVGVDG